jgi:hypothetical protein
MTGTKKNSITKAENKRGRRKRDTKASRKSETESSYQPDEESKAYNNQVQAERNMFFSKYGSVYAQYDDFLQKRKKNSRIEFIKLEPEPGEIIIRATSAKASKKKRTKNKANQDTF